jgi:hypothetical protein
MRIAWITPCLKAYDNIIPYLKDAESLGLEIHVFHNGISSSAPKNELYHLHISSLDKLREMYIILHYFLDSCNKCKTIKPKSLFGQRVFVTEDDSRKKFGDIIFKYFELI